MRTALLIAAFLAACAHTPAEVRQSNFRFDFESPQPKHRAAACAARNAEELSPQFSAITRPRDEQTVEVIVHAGTGTAIVVDVRDAANGGSALTVWLTSNIGRKEDLQDYATYMANTVAKGC